MANSMIRIGIRAFVLAFVILAVLMVAAGVMTRTIPTGSYERETVDGRTVVVPGSFSFTPAPTYPAWRWATAPFEVLAAPGNVAVISIIAFLVLVGGAFTVLETGDVLGAFLRFVAVRMSKRRFLLMAVIQLFFMAVAAVLGIYETMVPLIVFIVPLALSLGWDSLTGLGMSLLPLAFGFAASISNPFTIGVAQTIAELPLFSGAWLRAIIFVLTYALVFLYVRRHARRIERDPRLSPVAVEDARLREAIDAGTAAATDLPRPLRRALTFFAVMMGIAVVFIIATARIPALSDVAFILMALLFLIGGLGAGRLAGMDRRAVVGAFASGVVNLLPAVLLIMMSMSVKHIVETGGIMDTLLWRVGTVVAERSPGEASLLMYVATLGMNFFIGSASAKAFLMMPILTPLADLVGITRQTAVLAFGFGDGFSNMIFPTNVLLLIGLSFTPVSYGRWLRWTIPMQVVIVAMTVAFLLLAVAIGYGPF